MTTGYQKPSMEGLSIIPTGILEGIEKYFKHRIKPGGALLAILENDLNMAIFKSDPWTMAAMKEILWYLDRIEMGSTWGTPERVEAWLAKGVSHE
jgi:hypothetical protein